MPYQKILEVVRGRVPWITSTYSGRPIQDGQLQPASLDFRLGTKAFCMSSAALPHGEAVDDLVKRYMKYDFDLDFDGRGHLLERGRTYIIPQLEACELPDSARIEFSPKSSTGRTDVFCRVVSDRSSHYDLVSPGYSGGLYLEVTPLSFDVRVKAGMSLIQGRIGPGVNGRMSAQEIRDLHTREGMVFHTNGQPLSQGELVIRDDELYFHIDLDRDVVGFVAKSTAIHALDLTQVGIHDPAVFWEPIPRPKDGQLVLVPGNFYLLATQERIRIPAECCGQVVSYKLTTGELRPHYAGFFDPGFGGDSGTNGVLEVRSRDVPFRVVHGQPICSMLFQRMDEIPSVLYEGNYRENGPSLSKHFLGRYDAWERQFWASRW